MAHEAVKSEHTFTLPAAVVEPADIRRLSRELEELDDFLRQANIRKGGEATAAPKVTKTLDALADANGLNLLQAVDRAKAASFLDELVRNAPVVHMSFATDPSAAFTAKIVTWLRKNIHPLLLVQIGLQPSIAAGCIVRTNNKVFDFSLRQYVVERKDLLTKAIGSMETSKQPPTETGQPSAQQPVHAEVQA